ncbi:MAG: hypothetical protein ACJAWL_000719 [Motiliproteus sp.]|jgi:hypothetical protein
MTHYQLSGRLWLLLLLCISRFVVAAESAPATTAPAPAFEAPVVAPGWFDSSGRWLALQHEAFSGVVNDSAVGLDAYIARENFDESIANESYIKVQLKQRVSATDGYGFDATVRARVRLPNSKRKWRLTFDSDPDDFDRLADRNRNQTPGFNSPKTLKEDAIAGISLEKYLGKNWDSNYGLGVRLRFPVDLYARVSWVNSMEIGEHWQSRFKQGFSYFHSDGWKSETRKDFYRPLSPGWLLQSSTGAQYLNEDTNWELFQSLSLHQRISVDTAVEHQLGISGDSQPTLRHNGYWLRSELRHRLYEDWLLVKLTPELYFDRAERFHATPSLFLELEIYFGKAPD